MCVTMPDLKIAGDQSQGVMHAWVGFCKPGVGGGGGGVFSTLLVGIGSACCVSFCHYSETPEIIN